ncbi:MAG TPA: hypothetical protein VK826_13140 [Bacteroidia bacterium]|nr:hypothetical protein [Bacteroidia bacterium]
MSQGVKLNFINQSNDVNNSEVVIFQKNVVPGYEEIAVAWTVIQNCGQGDNHPFDYPFQSYVTAADSYGNYEPLLLANPGDAFQMVLNNSGDRLEAAGSANSAQEIDVKNNLAQGSISAWIYKAGKPLAVKTNIVPGQMAAFNFKPTIFIGVASQVEEGEVMNSAIISQINTEISLLGIASADIIMTGGGAGTGSVPFQFTLQNVKMA